MELADEQEGLRRALSGDEAARNRLALALLPVIQARVARSLLRWRLPAGRGRSVRQEVEDLSQDVLLLLFADGGKVLRTWQPERGLALSQFVGLVAERRTVSSLRSGRRSPWKEDPTLPEELDREAPDRGPEEVVASREELRFVLRRLAEELTPLGRQLFDLLFLQELPLPEIVARTALSADAVYAWRSRLRKLARQLLAEGSEKGPQRRTGRVGGVA